MVRGRRTKAVAKATTEINGVTAKKKDTQTQRSLKEKSNMESCCKVERGGLADFSPPITRSRRNNRTKKAMKQDSPKNSQITNYFQIVSTANCFQNGHKETGYKSDSLEDDDDYKDYQLDEDHFKFDIADINQVIYSEVADNKKLILNNIFKKENCTVLYNDERRNNGSSDDSQGSDIFVKTENEYIGNDVENNSNDDDNQHILPNLRLSPRKHASTLQRCVVTKENIKTPHRISLCDNLESNGTQKIELSQSKYRSRRKLNTKQKLDLLDIGVTNQQPKEKIKKIEDADYKMLSVKAEKPVNGVTNHKLTDYFPIRRSVRKTKKEVMEQKQRDIEIAIQKQTEDGLEVTCFEGKGRGVVASRKFHRGEFVVEYSGELVDTAVAREREAHYAQDHATGCYMYYFRHNNQNYCIDATAETGRLGRLVNHSRNGNLITKTIFMDGRPYLVLLANQDILPGEEITYDYGDRSKESLQHHPWLAL